MSTIKITITDKAAAGRNILWERDPTHPSGEVYLVGGRKGEHEVGNTAAIRRKIGEGYLELVEEKSGEPLELTNVAGIGPKTAEKLAGQGLTTIAQLAELDEAAIESFAGFAGVSVEKFTEFVTAAGELVSSGDEDE